MNNLSEQIELTLNSWAGIANRDVNSINLLHRTYRNLFDESVQTGCGNCNQKAFLRIRRYVELNKLNLTTMANKNLKERKYLLREGSVLQVNFGTDTYTNDNLTDEVAAELVASNPNYKAAFSRLPEDSELEAASQDYAKREAKKQESRLQTLKQIEKDTNTKVETDLPVKSGRIDDPVAASQVEKVLIDETEKLPTQASPRAAEASGKGQEDTDKAEPKGQAKKGNKE